MVDLIRRTMAAALVLTILPLSGCGPGKPAAQNAESGLDVIPLTITTKSGTRSFKVEVARTFEEQNEGLMYRRDMADDAGMLFPFPKAKDASFWMHNTFIPLDIIFIREDKTIARIAEETVPQSDEPVVAGQPVTAVLELKGGTSAALGISAGDKVSWDK